jgi:hypothetical protein
MLNSAQEVKHHCGNRRCAGSEQLTLWLNCSTAGGDKQQYERFAFGAYLSCQYEGKTIPIWLGAIANNRIHEMEIGIEFSKKSWESVSNRAVPKSLLGADLTDTVYWWPISGCQAALR